MNKYYSAFGIQKIFLSEYYSVFGIRYSDMFHERIIFGIRKFFMNEYYSVFGNSSWTNIFGIRYSKSFHERILFDIRYSDILHERINSVFGIRKFFMNEYYSVFGNSSWTNKFTIRYSVKLTIQCKFTIQCSSA